MHVWALHLGGATLSVVAAMMTGMTITMQNYGLTWTDVKGTPRASAVAYDKPSGERQKRALEAEGCTDVELVPVKPGTLPEPRS
jgi:hypothetical protein